MLARILLFALSLVTGVGTHLTLLAQQPSQQTAALSRGDLGDHSVWGPRSTAIPAETSGAEVSGSRRAQALPATRHQRRAAKFVAVKRAIVMHRPSYPDRRTLYRALAKSAADDPAS